MIKVDPRAIAVSTFLDLFKAVTERKSSDCYNKCLCISTSETSRSYIGFSYVLSDAVILCEVNDIYPRLNKSQIVSNLTIIEYIQNLGSVLSITRNSHENNACPSHSETHDWMY